MYERCRLPIAAERTSAGSTVRTILVVDDSGEIYDRVHDLDLPWPARHVRDPREVRSYMTFEFAVCASYGPPEWDRLSLLTERSSALIVTTAYSRDEMAEALRRSFIGYVNGAVDDVLLDRLIRAAVAHGEALYPRQAIGEWMREMQHSEMRVGENSALTERQRQIVTLVATGATDKEIASRLGIAHATAQKHITNILHRLGVPNRAAAVAVLASAHASA